MYRREIFFTMKEEPWLGTLKSHKNTESTIPLLVAPNNGPANTSPLEIQRHVCGNAHHPAAVLEPRAGKEDRAQRVRLPLGPSTSSAGLPEEGAAPQIKVGTLLHWAT